MNDLGSEKNIDFSELTKGLDGGAEGYIGTDVDEMHSIISVHLRPKVLFTQGTLHPRYFSPKVISTQGIRLSSRRCSKLVTGRDDLLLRV